MANSFPGSGLAYADQFAIGRSSGTGLLNTFLSADPSTNQIRVETDNSSVLTYIGISAGTMEYYRGANTSGTLNFKTKVQAASLANGGGAIVFSPNGTASDYTPVERMRILMNGNVGIGTDVPSYKLDIGGSGPSIGLSSTSATGYNEMYFSRNTSTVVGYIGVGVNAAVTANGDDFVIQNRLSTGNLVLHTNTTERMRITSTGQVAIGATSNLNNFTIKSSSDTITSGGLSFQSRTCVTNFIAMGLNSSNDFEIQTWTTPSWLTRLYIKNDGNIGIGTTSPSYKLQSDTNAASTCTDSIVAQNSGVTTVGHTTGIRFRFNTSEPAAIRTVLENTSTGTARLGLFVSTDNTGANLTERLSINCNGNVGINCSAPTYKLHVNGTFYAAGSSQDYKQSICNYNTDSCMFMKLKPVTYQYKEEYCHLGKELKSGTQIGLIAEEVAESHPELAILVNEEDNKVVRNVDYEKLTIILLSELQKLRQEVDQLKNK